MKIRILTVLLGISILLIIILVIYTVEVEPECERLHLNDINRSEDIDYLDEEMARKLADIVTGAESGFINDEKIRYDVEIDFDEQSYEWVVSYVPKEAKMDNEAYLDKVVRIRKDNGIITVWDKENIDISELCIMEQNGENYMLSIKSWRGDLVFSEEYIGEPVVQIVNGDTFLIIWEKGDGHTYTFVNVNEGIVSENYNGISAYNQDKAVYAEFIDDSQLMVEY